MISCFQNWFEMAVTMRGGIDNGPYGLGHWRRVFSVARAINQGKQNNVISAFCVLHDACTHIGRQYSNDDGRPDGNVEEVYIVADAIANAEVDSDFMTNCEIRTLHAAIEYSRCSSNAEELFFEDEFDKNVINICWDAEDMDEWRFGHLPSPEKMRTKTGSMIARQSKDLMMNAWKNPVEKMFALNPESCFSFSI